MKVGKLCTIGDSVGIVVPRQYREQLGWMKGDQIAQQINGNSIVLHNVTERLTRTAVRRKEYGDGRVNGVRRVR